jgi:hypothetical protein
MEPITPLQALEILLETIDGYDHSWEEVNRAKLIVRNRLEECLDE